MAPVRIGLDISALDPNFKEHAHRGIGRYVRELKNYFDGFSGNKNAQVNFFDHTHFRAGRALDSLINCAPLGRETIRQQLVYPLKLARSSQRGHDVLHFPAHMDAPSWSPMPYLITVLDLIPIVCQELYQDTNASWRFHLARWLELRAIKNAARVLVISENTGRDVHRLLGVPWERISVTPLGVSEEFYRDVDSVEVSQLRDRLKIERGTPHLLYVGGIDQRKNWGFMLRVLAELKKACTEQGRRVPRLVMSGRIERDRQYPRLKALVEELKLQQEVLEVGFISDQDLPVLYHACDVFFFPSLYEGFGLTPLEALATGAAVVSSDTSVMPEVLGDSADYISPTDVSQAVLKIYQALFVIPQTEDLKAKRRSQARKFTWKRTGETTFEAYEQYARSI